MKSFAIEWDMDYGIDHRCGWSVTGNGIVLAQLEPTMELAIKKALDNVVDSESVDRNQLLLVFEALGRRIHAMNLGVSLR